jgi:hypothetical protein
MVTIQTDHGTFQGETVKEAHRLAKAAARADLPGITAEDFAAGGGQ